MENRMMDSMDEAEPTNVDGVTEPTCGCCNCCKTSTLINVISFYSMILGGIVFPFFIILYFFGVIPPEYFELTDPLNPTTFFIIIAKCIIMVIGGVFGYTAVKTKSKKCLFLFLIWMSLMCILNIVLVSLRQYGAVVALVIWMYLIYEVSKYYSYLSTLAGDDCDDDACNAPLLVDDNHVDNDDNAVI